MICPYCKKNNSAPKPLWPFCSERCKTSDLGRWAKEEYRIAGKSIDEEELEGSAPDTSPEDRDD